MLVDIVLFDLNKNNFLSKFINCDERLEIIPEFLKKFKLKNVPRHPPQKPK